MTLTAQHIANYYLRRDRDRILSMPITKLFLLVYLAYGWVAAVLDRELFDGEIHAEAWGPSIPSLLHLDGGLENRSGEMPNDENLLFVLDYVWDVYRSFTTEDLLKSVKAKGTPWREAYDENHIKNPIYHEDIQDWFKANIEECLELPVKEGKDG